MWEWNFLENFLETKIPLNSFELDRSGEDVIDPRQANHSARNMPENNPVSKMRMH